MRPIVRITIRTSRGASPTAAMPGPGGEAEALGLRPGVADHEGRGHRGRGEDRAGVEAGRHAAGRDADVDDALAGPVEDRVHEGAELRRLAGRPRERAVEQVEDAADDQRGRPATSQACMPAATAATIAIPKPISVRGSGVRPSRPKRDARSAWRGRGRAGAAPG